jgi:tRNA G18 (ribose-2'-O)-methylase SpoU
MPADMEPGVNWQQLLCDPAGVRARGLFIAEGRLVIDRILRGATGGAEAIVAVLATPAAVRALDLESRLAGRVTVRTPAEMEAVTGFNFHRGVLALVRRPAMLDVRDVIEPAVAIARAGTTATAGLSARPVFVVAEHLADVDNVGSCFRNARGFGASGVLLDERCPDPLYRKAVRTSLGHVLELPWSRAPMEAIREGLARHAVTTIGLTPAAAGRASTVETLADLSARLHPFAPVALVVGNEGTGLSDAAMDACAHLACIPMAAGADSLNVATALAVSLYELTTQR